MYFSGSGKISLSPSVKFPFVALAHIVKTCRVSPEKKLHKYEVRGQAPCHRYEHASPLDREPMSTETVVIPLCRSTGSNSRTSGLRCGDRLPFEGCFSRGLATNLSLLACDRSPFAVSVSPCIPFNQSILEEKGHREEPRRSFGVERSLSDVSSW